MTYRQFCNVTELPHRKRDDDKINEDDTASDRTNRILDLLFTPRSVNITILNTVCGLAFGSFMSTYR